MVLDYANGNAIGRNLFENGGIEVQTHYSSNNTFFNNNFLSNNISTREIYSTNNWSVQGRGNYWGDYTGLDDGSNGRVAGDGVGDTDLPWQGVDYYPLTAPENPVQIVWDNQAFSAMLASNSTVSSFVFDQTNKRMTFSVIGSDGTEGYFNLSLPKALLSGPWTVLLDGTDVTSETTVTENTTQTTFHLIYNQTDHSVQITGTNVVPEFSSLWLLMALFLILTSALLVRARNSRRSNLTLDFDNSNIS